MNEFISKLAEILDTEDVLNPDMSLSDLEGWDSLAFVAFLAMANVSYGKKIKAEDVKNAKTIADLYNLVK